MDSKGPEPTSRSSAADLGPASGARLRELIALAQAYRGWSQKELARFLGRDPHNLVPDSGIPKLDLVARLADALDWPVASVVEDVCGRREFAKDGALSSGSSFEELDRDAYAAYTQGDFHRMAVLAGRAFAAARSADQRAQATIRECGAWDGLGRFQSAIWAAQRGLAAHGLSAKYQALLRNNLAGAYYALGQLAEADGVATANLERVRSMSDSSSWHGSEAFALYVRGNCNRMWVDIHPADSVRHAESARSDLELAESIYLRVADEQDVSSYAGIAHSCRGAILTVLPILGERTNQSVIEEIVTRIESVVDLTAVPKGDWLESYGWWCIFGCQVASRSLAESAELDRVMAILTNKADEIAESLGNWPLRERVFSYEHLRRKTRESTASLDREDLRVLAGAMGRFPTLRPIGWDMIGPSPESHENR